MTNDQIEALCDKLGAEASDVEGYTGEALREAAAALREMRAENERLRAENERLKETERNCWSSPEAWTAWCDIRVLERAEKAEAERDEFQRLLGKATSERDTIRADVERLRAGYAECLEDLQSWAGYASDYFRTKHDLAGDIARHSAAIAASKDK